jgi:transposase InsO family protein
MKYAFIKEHRVTHAIRKLCALLQVSPAGYYEWRDRKQSPRAKREQELLAKIVASHENSRNVYGSPRVHADLTEQGEQVGRKCIARIMRKHRLKGRMRRAFRRTTDSNHGGPIAPNLLARKFDVTVPNTHWVGDITYIPTKEGWLYLAIVLDLASRKVVGWSMKSHMRSDLVIDAMSMALKSRKPRRGVLMFHSDRGSQYASDDFLKILKKYGIKASMSEKGQCWDNAVAESFFGTLKGELNDPIWVNREIASAGIFEYIEIWYNRVRKHSKLGYRSPVGYEIQLAQTN